MGLLQLSKLPGKWLRQYANLPWLLQWALICVPALILYWPILGNSFVADDFIVLKKNCLDKQLNTDGLFRPLSDITLHLNYVLYGFQPAGFYLWSIPFHALATVLLFHFCMLFKWTDDECKKLTMAGLSALLFLFYPFHSESIHWVLGRGALMSNTFGLLALVCMLSNWKTYQKMATVAICYFIGMLAYESVMVLPAMVFVWLLATSSSIKDHLKWMGAMIFTLVLHFIVRVKISGTVTGDYGADFFKVNALGILTNSGKSLGRLFLPPIADSRVMVVLFLLLAIVAGVVVMKLWKKLVNDRKAKLYFLQILAFLFIALLIPCLFGVSTHTTESDRFLHFPSFFACMLISFCLVCLLQYRRSLPIVVAAIVMYFIYCVQETNNNWRKASVAVTSLLQIAREHAGKGELYVVNLPDEIDGAFVFRSGLPEALLLHQLDTASVTIVNQVKRDTLLTLPGIIDAQVTSGGVFIAPQVLINKSGAQPVVAGKEKVITISPAPGDQIVYWNNKMWIRL